MTRTQHMILRYIWKKSSVLRKDISRHFRINPSTVTRNLKPLLDMGIIKSTGFVSSGSVGRKSEVISINDEWRKFVGISIEYGGITALLLDFRGRILKEASRRIEIDSGNLFDVLKEMLEDFDEFQVMTVAVPGTVLNEKMVYSQTLKLEKFEFSDRLEKEFGVKAFVLSSASSAVANFSDKSDNLVCFLLSIPYRLDEKVRVSAGIWLNGTLYTGFHGLAGETGSGLSISPSGGTVDDLVAGKVEVSEEFIEKISEKMGILGQFIDPEIVILSGDTDILKEDVIFSIVSRMREYFLSDVEIEVDLSGRRSVARGSFMALINMVLGDVSFMEEFLLSRRV